MFSDGYKWNFQTHLKFMYTISGKLVKCVYGFLFFFFFVGLKIVLGAWCLESRHSTAWETSPGHFAVLILEMRSLKVFAWADLKWWSSWSLQVPRITGMSHWCLAMYLWISLFLHLASSIELLPKFNIRIHFGKFRTIYFNPSSELIANFVRKICFFL
jgi:hypothetical protein